MSLPRWLPLIAVLAILVVACAARPASPQQMKVFCPAVEIDDRSRSNNPMELEMPPELVVVGRLLRDAEDVKRVKSVEVAEVLYGGIADRGASLPPPAYCSYDRAIIAYQWGVHGRGGRYVCRNALKATPTNVAAVRALSRARLSLNALRSTFVFVGRELPRAELGIADNPFGIVDDDYIHRVAVERVLKGSLARPGEEIEMEIGGYIRTTGERSTLVPEPMVYFTVERSRRSQGKMLSVITRVDASAERVVLAALVDEYEHPIVDVQRGDERFRRREISFQGNTTQAIEILGSDSRGAVNLAHRFLMHREKDSLAAVVDAARRELLAFSHGDRERFKRLKSLIRLLGSMKSDAARNAVHSLINTYLAHVESGATAPPDTDRRTPYWSHEEDQDDVNHALAWLVAATDKADALRRHGARLIRLRDGAAGNWRRELQLALDVGEMEDQIELRAAFMRMRHVTPVRSRPGVRHSGTVSAVSYSHDGKLLAMGGSGGGVTIWDTKRWSLVSRIEADGTIEELAFSPDDKLIYVAGGGGGLQIHARYDVTTGKLDREYTGHKTGIFWMALASDGRTMMTASYYEDKTHLWDTDTGEVKRTWDLGDRCYDLAASPDGRLFARKTAKKEVSIEHALPGKEDTCKLSLDGYFGPQGKVRQPLCGFLPDVSVLVAQQIAEHGRRLPGVRPDEP
jgi:hypothetical protein